MDVTYVYVLVKRESYNWETIMVFSDVTKAGIALDAVNKTHSGEYRIQEWEVK